ncbi:MAG: hypothetical protein [Inoviridae sp.]|nr:MAG: hypothetical protein [Inoviridae sp.]
MKKRLTSFILVLALSFSLSVSAFAVDDNDYYSLSPVGSFEPSVALDRSVIRASSYDGFLAEDSQNLARIMTDLTTTRLTTLKSYIIDIRDSLSRGGAVFGYLSDVTNALTAQTTRGTLAWYIKQIDASLASISSSFGGGFATEATLSKVATENTLSSFLSHFDYFFSPVDGTSPTMKSGYFIPELQDRTTLSYMSYPWVIGSLYSNFLYDGYQPYHANADDFTLYHFIKNLSLTLASDDDRQLAENYKPNREQVEDDFLSGQSGPTSLGKGDFANASQVGGALNDTFNMGGAAKVSDFVSGFGTAGHESLSWFSDTTANNLDGVIASGNSISGVSTFADDGETMVDIDSDPYNMAEIYDRYDWLEGVLG